MRYVQALSSEDMRLLEHHYKTSSNHRERERCKALLLSQEGHNIRALAAYFAVDADTIHHWIKRWETPLPTEQSPLDRLKDAFRSGRPSLLAADQKKSRASLAAFFTFHSHLSGRFGSAV